MKIRLIIGVIISFTLFSIVGLDEVVADELDDAKLVEEILEKSKREVNIEGVVQDVEGNPVDGVTLHIWTESLTGAWTGKTEERYYRRFVNSPFCIQLPACHNVRIAAEKEGYRGTSGYYFDTEEELSAKDVIIRLNPYVRSSRLDSALAWPEINEKGESFMYSFKRWRKVSLKWKPDPYDIYVYLDIKDEPKIKHWGTHRTEYISYDSVPVALVGVAVEFCEGFPYPPLKYRGQGGLSELSQAPEEGYVSRIEVDNPHDLENRCFYFRTRKGKYGKLRINDCVDTRDRLLVGFKYYYQPDGTRDIAGWLHFTPTDMTPPVTTDNYQHNGVWTNEGAEITLTATDDVTGVANTYYTIAQIQHEGTGISITDEGEHIVKYWSVDNAGNVEAENTITVKIDKTAPEVSISAEPSILWPVNKEPVQVTISGIATDNLSGISSKEFTVSDEYDEITVNVADFEQIIELIPWRTGDDEDGRIYTIELAVTDKAGNSTTQGTTVIVPHDMRDDEE